MDSVWNLSLQTKENDKRKELYILLNRNFAPKPRAYFPMEKSLPDKKILSPDSATIDTDQTENISQSIQRQLEKDSKTDTAAYKNMWLPEVTVSKQKMLTKEEYAIKNTSIQYNIPQELDKIRDQGDDEPSDIIHFLEKTNLYFKIVKIHNGEPTKKGAYIYKAMYETSAVTYFYKNNPVYFILNNNVLTVDDAEIPEDIDAERIESVRIVENRFAYDIFCKQLDDPTDIKSSFRKPVCIFLYTYPDKASHAASFGTRSTTLQGYFSVKEFYAPSYPEEVPPFEKDHRRTLYWNPNVRTDSTGKAEVDFYNNSACRRLLIEAEEVTRNGKIMLFKTNR